MDIRATIHPILKLIDWACVLIAFLMLWFAMAFGAAIPWMICFDQTRYFNGAFVVMALMVVPALLSSKKAWNGMKRAFYHDGRFFPPEEPRPAPILKPTPRLDAALTVLGSLVITVLVVVSLPIALYIVYQIVIALPIAAAIIIGALIIGFAILASQS